MGSLKPLSPVPLVWLASMSPLLVSDDSLLLVDSVLFGSDVFFLRTGMLEP